MWSVNQFLRSNEPCFIARENEVRSWSLDARGSTQKKHSRNSVNTCALCIVKSLTNLVKTQSLKYGRYYVSSLERSEKTKGCSNLVNARGPARKNSYLQCFKRVLITQDWAMKWLVEKAKLVRDAWSVTKRQTWFTITADQSTCREM